MIRGETMASPMLQQIAFFSKHRFVVIGLACMIVLSLAASDGQTVDSDLSVCIRARHLLGFADAKQNVSGTLTVQKDTLQFSPSGKPAVTVPVDSIHDIFVGAQSRQIGGLPMTLGKAAVPYGGGRAISLFSKKKYDTITVNYVDEDGGVHGAIFQADKGEAEKLRKQLVAAGARGGHDTIKTGNQDRPEAKNE